MVEINTHEAGRLRITETELTKQSRNPFESSQDRSGIQTILHGENLTNEVLDTVRGKLHARELDRQALIVNNRVETVSAVGVEFSSVYTKLETVERIKANQSAELAAPKDAIKIEMRPETKELVKDVLDYAAEKLTELGVIVTSGMLPEENHICYYVSSEGHWGGFADIFPPQIIIIIPNESVEIQTSAIAQEIIYHEITHFISQHVLVSENVSAIGISAEGFDRYNKSHRLGVYQEPMAELFSRYCMDYSESGMTTPYVLQVPFMIAFLEDYAERAQCTSKEAFRKWFVATVTRDFSLQTEATSMYGVEFMRMLNGIERSDKDTRSNLNAMKSVAAMGGFQDRFNNLSEDLLSGRPIVFPGITGNIYAASGRTESDSVVYY